MRTIEIKLLIALALATATLYIQIEWRQLDSAFANAWIIVGGLIVAYQTALHLALIWVARTTNRTPFRDRRQVTFFEIALGFGSIVPVVLGANIVAIYAFFIVSVPLGLLALPIAFAVERSEDNRVAISKIEASEGGDTE